MGESYFFRQIESEVGKKKRASEVQPLTEEEREEPFQEPMALKDHWLSLRRSIQEKLHAEEPSSAEDLERTKLLQELITPELVGDYKQILKKFKEKAERSEKHQQGEFIDINDKEVAGSIENWIEGLLDEIKEKKRIGLNQADAQES